MAPVVREGLYSWVGANYSAYWGRTLEEVIKKRLGGLRPDFPVAGQVHSTVRKNYIFLFPGSRWVRSTCRTFTLIY